MALAVQVSQIGKGRDVPPGAALRGNELVRGGWMNTKQGGTRLKSHELA